VHLLVGGQELPAASKVAEEEFTIDQFVAGHVFDPVASTTQ
jgi:hypothetical protein